MRSITKLIVGLALLGAALGMAIGIASSLAGSDFENQTATQKLAAIWTQIQADNGASAEFPGAFALIGIFIEDLWVTGRRSSDIMPEGRQKLIHSVGAVAQAKFNWNSAASKYTGLFRQADNVILRASSATKPGQSDGGLFSKPSKTYAPGLSFKIFRDNVPSANFFAMWQLDGQQDFNFFLNPLANHVPARPDLPLQVKLLGKKFGTVSQFPGLVGLSDFAAFRQDGTAEAKANFPFALVFQPNSDITERFRDTTEFDIPAQFSRSFAGNEPLYRVFAVPTVDSTALEYVGDLVLKSKFTGSKFADQQLFFRHVFIEEDFKLRPDWLAAFNEEKSQTEGAQKYQPYLPQRQAMKL
eukprot:Opistho-2@3570